MQARLDRPERQAELARELGQRFSAAVEAVEQLAVERLEPRERSFLEVDPPSLHVSAVKQSEDGSGWVVRLFNPGTGTAEGRIRLNGGIASVQSAGSPVARLKKSFRLNGLHTEAWSAVRQVTLEEAEDKDLAMDAEGWVPVKLGRKQILTVKFTP